MSTYSCGSKHEITARKGGFYLRNKVTQELMAHLGHLVAKIETTLAPVNTDGLLDLYDTPSSGTLKNWVTACDATLGEVNTRVLNPAGFVLILVINAVYSEDWSHMECLRNDNEDRCIGIYDFGEAVHDFYYRHFYQPVLRHLRIPMIVLIPAAHICAQAGLELSHISISKDT